MADNSNEKIDLERAWKDEEYRNSLTPEQLAQIPANPAGNDEMSEQGLDNVDGGALNAYLHLRNYGGGGPMG